MSNEYTKKHNLLVRSAFARLGECGWTFPPIDYIGRWDQAFDGIAFHPVRGPVGIICHARESSKKYCVRDAQIKTALDWDAPVYIIFENFLVIQAREFGECEVKKISGNFPYRELPGDFPAHEFLTVFG